MIKNNELIQKIIEAISNHSKEVTKLIFETRGEDTYISIYVGEMMTIFSSQYVENIDEVAEDFIIPALESLYPDDEE